MERGTESSKGWGRENLALPTEKSDETPEKYGHSTCPSGCNICLYGNGLGICSFSMHPASETGYVGSTDGYWKFSSLPLRSRKINGTVSGYSEASVFCGEPKHIGLNLGRPKEYGDSFSRMSTTKSLVPTIPVSGTVSKRSRAYHPNLQNPFCQVDGCNLDLISAKDYHRRHRICESHSKCPSITVSGRQRRFCQQCSRLQDLSEFDDKKRSCRRRLSDHNARRRRLATRLSSPTGLPSALYGVLSTLPNSIFPSSYSLNPPRISLTLADQGPHNVLLDRLSVPVLNQTWENNSISVADPSKVGGLEGTKCFSGNKIHDSDPGMLCAIRIPSAQDLDQCSNVIPDLMSVHSLLSYNPWTLNEAIPTPAVYSSDANSNYNPERHVDPHHWAALVHSSNNISTGQGGIQAPNRSTQADYESGFNHSDQRIL